MMKTNFKSNVLSRFDKCEIHLAVCVMAFVYAYEILKPRVQFHY